MPAAYVKPYVKRNKTDGRDAEAICEAMQRPTMRFVAVKRPEQQATMAVHRTRALLVRQRTMAAKALRAAFAEFGVVAPQGRKGLEALIALLPEPAVVPEPAHAALAILARQWQALDADVKALERQIVQIARNDAPQFRQCQGEHHAACLSGNDLHHLLGIYQRGWVIGIVRIVLAGKLVERANLDNAQQGLPSFRPTLPEGGRSEQQVYRHVLTRGIDNVEEVRQGELSGRSGFGRRDAEAHVESSWSQGRLRALSDILRLGAKDRARVEEIEVIRGQVRDRLRESQGAFEATSATVIFAEPSESFPCVTKHVTFVPSFFPRY